MILITGGTGLAGYQLKKMIPAAICIDSSTDLRDTVAVNLLFEKLKPTKVIHCAAKVGGLGGNMNYKGEFFYDNIMINTNVIEACRKYNVEKLVCFLSTCVFPNDVEYPLTEEKIHLGEPHSSNYPYAYAKRMVDVMSRAYRQQYGCNFITVIPNNLYGENDNFDLEKSHVVPALIRKFLQAKKENIPIVEVWGTGSATREFLYVEDTAKAILDVAEKFNQSGPLNLGTGVETSIKELVETIVELTEYDGQVIWNTDRPDGQARRFYCMERFKKHMGYVPSTSLREGLRKTIDWYLNSSDKKRL